MDLSVVEANTHKTDNHGFTLIDDVNGTARAAFEISSTQASTAAISSRRTLGDVARRPISN
jgi:hypothetical protein